MEPWLNVTLDETWYHLCYNVGIQKECAMKVLNSLRSAKKRDAHSQVVRRNGRHYIINKRNPRLKARQG